jgi:DNA-binding CsgD family transcriptional regulator
MLNVNIDENIASLSQHRHKKDLNKKRIKTGGRQLVLFNEEQIKIVESLAYNKNCDQIAAHFGISKATFFNLRKRQIDVEKAYKKGRINLKIALGSLLYKKALAGHTSSLIFVLKTKCGWGSKYYKREQEMLKKEEEEAKLSDYQNNQNLKNQ